jgi:hypothetical protein
MTASVEAQALRQSIQYKKKNINNAGRRKEL